MTGPSKNSRRANLTKEEVLKMMAMEAEGKTRKEISVEMKCTPACVTRQLGTKRRYTRRARADEALAVVTES